MLKRLIEATRRPPCACPVPKKRKDRKKKDGKIPKDRKPDKRLRFANSKVETTPEKPRGRLRSLTIWPKEGNKFIYPYDFYRDKPKKDKPVRELPNYYYTEKAPVFKEKAPSVKSLPYKHAHEKEKPIYNNDDGMSYDEYNRIFHKEPIAPLTSEYKEKKRKGRSRLSTWNQKRKTYNELKTYYAKENKVEKKERIKREKERRIKEEELLSRLRGPTTMGKHKKKIVVARTEKVIVKKTRGRHEDCELKFINCCYRLCCQFYCCLTCLVIITFFIIFVL